MREFTYNSVVHSNESARRKGGHVGIEQVRSDKIVMPTTLQKFSVNWYQYYPLHMVMYHTEFTIINPYY